MNRGQGDQTDHDAELAAFMNESDSMSEEDYLAIASGAANSDAKRRAALERQRKLEQQRHFAQAPPRSSPPGQFRSLGHDNDEEYDDSVDDRYRDIARKRAEGLRGSEMVLSTDLSAVSNINPYASTGTEQDSFESYHHPSGNHRSNLQKSMTGGGSKSSGPVNIPASSNVRGSGNPSAPGERRYLDRDMLQGRLDSPTADMLRPPRLTTEDGDFDSRYLRGSSRGDGRGRTEDDDDGRGGSRGGLGGAMFSSRFGDHDESDIVHPPFSNKTDQVGADNRTSSRHYPNTTAAASNPSSSIEPAKLSRSLDAWNATSNTTSTTDHVPSAHPPALSVITAPSGYIPPSTPSMSATSSTTPTATRPLSSLSSLSAQSPTDFGRVTTFTPITPPSPTSPASASPSPTRTMTPTSDPPYMPISSSNASLSTDPFQSDINHPPKSIDSTAFTSATTTTTTTTPTITSYPSSSSSTSLPLAADSNPEEVVSILSPYLQRVAKDIESMECQILSKIGPGGETHDTATLPYDLGKICDCPMLGVKRPSTITEAALRSCVTACREMIAYAVDAGSLALSRRTKRMRQWNQGSLTSSDMPSASSHPPSSSIAKLGGPLDKYIELHPADAIDGGISILSPSIAPSTETKGSIGLDNNTFGVIRPSQALVESTLLRRIRPLTRNAKDVARLTTAPSSSFSSPSSSSSSSSSSPSQPSQPFTYASIPATSLSPLTPSAVSSEIRSLMSILAQSTPYVPSTFSQLQTLPSLSSSLPPLLSTSTSTSTSTSHPLLHVMSLCFTLFTPDLADIDSALVTFRPDDGSSSSTSPPEYPLTSTPALKDLESTLSSSYPSHTSSSPSSLLRQSLRLHRPALRPHSLLFNFVCAYYRALALASRDATPSALSLNSDHEMEGDDDDDDEVGPVSRFFNSHYSPSSPASPIFLPLPVVLSAIKQLQDLSFLGSRSASQLSSFAASLSSSSSTLPDSPSSSPPSSPSSPPLSSAAVNTDVLLFHAVLLFTISYNNLVRFLQSVLVLCIHANTPTSTPVSIPEVVSFSVFCTFVNLLNPSFNASAGNIPATALFQRALQMMPVSPTVSSSSTSSTSSTLTSLNPTPSLSSLFASSTRSSNQASSATFGVSLSATIRTVIESGILTPAQFEFTTVTSRQSSSVPSSSSSSVSMYGSVDDDDVAIQSDPHGTLLVLLSSASSLWLGSLTSTSTASTLPTSLPFSFSPGKESSPLFPILHRLTSIFSQASSSALLSASPKAKSLLMQLHRVASSLETTSFNPSNTSATFLLSAVLSLRSLLLHLLPPLPLPLAPPPAGQPSSSLWSILLSLSSVLPTSTATDSLLAPFPLVSTDISNQALCAALDLAILPNLRSSTTTQSSRLSCPPLGLFKPLSVLLFTQILSNSQILQSLLPSTSSSPTLPTPPMTPLSVFISLLRLLQSRPLLQLISPVTAATSTTLWDHTKIRLAAYTLLLVPHLPPHSSLTSSTASSSFAISSQTPTTGLGGLEWATPALNTSFLPLPNGLDTYLLSTLNALASSASPTSSSTSVPNPFFSPIYSIADIQRFASEGKVPFTYLASPTSPSSPTLPPLLLSRLESSAAAIQSSSVTSHPITSIPLPGDAIFTALLLYRLSTISESLSFTVTQVRNALAGVASSVTTLTPSLIIRSIISAISTAYYAGRLPKDFTTLTSASPTTSHEHATFSLIVQCLRANIQSPSITAPSSISLSVHTSPLFTGLTPLIPFLSAFALSLGLPVEKVPAASMPLQTAPADRQSTTSTATAHTAEKVTTATASSSSTAPSTSTTSATTTDAIATTTTTTTVSQVEQTLSKVADKLVTTPISQLFADSSSASSTTTATTVPVPSKTTPTTSVTKSTVPSSTSSITQSKSTDTSGNLTTKPTLADRIVIGSVSETKQQTLPSAVSEGKDEWKHTEYSGNQSTSDGSLAVALNRSRSSSRTGDENENLPSTARGLNSSDSSADLSGSMMVSSSMVLSSLNPAALSALVLKLRRSQRVAHSHIVDLQSRVNILTSELESERQRCTKLIAKQAEIKEEAAKENERGNEIYKQEKEALMREISELKGRIDKMVAGQLSIRETVKITGRLPNVTERKELEKEKEKIVMEFKQMEGIIDALNAENKKLNARIKDATIAMYAPSAGTSNATSASTSSSNSGGSHVGISNYSELQMLRDEVVSLRTQLAHAHSDLEQKKNASEGTTASTTAQTGSIVRSDSNSVSSDSMRNDNDISWKERYEDLLKNHESTVAVLSNKVQWYVDNQALLDDYEAREVQLRRQVEVLRQEASDWKTVAIMGPTTKAASTTTTTSSSSSSGGAGKKIDKVKGGAENRVLSQNELLLQEMRADKKRITDLEKQVSQLQSALKSKRPDSAAALVAASLPSADESRTTHELALKIKKKEEEIEEVERRNKLKLRTLAQENDRARLAYERRLEAQQRKYEEELAALKALKPSARIKQLESELSTLRMTMVEELKIMAQKVDEEKKKAGDVQDELSHEREKRLHLETELQKVMNGNYIGQHATVPVTTDPTTGPASAKESSTSSSPAVVAPLPEGHIPLSELERHISFVKNHLLEVHAKERHADGIRAKERMLLATKSLEERCEALQNQLAADQKLFAARESELRAQLQRMTEQREAAVTERLKLVEANSELSSMIQRLQEEPAHARVAGLMEKVRLMEERHQSIVYDLQSAMTQSKEQAEIERYNYRKQLEATRFKHEAEVDALKAKLSVCEQGRVDAERCLVVSRSALESVAHALSNEDLWAHSASKGAHAGKRRGSSDITDHDTTDPRTELGSLVTQMVNLIKALDARNEVSSETNSTALDKRSSVPASSNNDNASSPLYVTPISTHSRARTSVTAPNVSHRSTTDRSEMGTTSASSPPAASPMALADSPAALQVLLSTEPKPRLYSASSSSSHNSLFSPSPAPITPLHARLAASSSLSSSLPSRGAHAFYDSSSAFTAGPFRPPTSDALSSPFSASSIGASPSTTSTTDRTSGFSTSPARPSSPLQFDAITPPKSHLGTDEPDAVARAANNPTIVDALFTPTPGTKSATSSYGTGQGNAGETKERPVFYPSTWSTTLSHSAGVLESPLPAASSASQLLRPSTATNLPSAASHSSSSTTFSGQNSIPASSISTSGTTTTSIQTPSTGRGPSTTSTMTGLKRSSTATTVMNKPVIRGAAPATKPTTTSTNSSTSQAKSVTARGTVNRLATTKPSLKPSTTSAAPLRPTKSTGNDSAIATTTSTTPPSTVKEQTTVANNNTNGADANDASTVTGKYNKVYSKLAVGKNGRPTLTPQNILDIDPSELSNLDYDIDFAAFYVPE